MKNIRKCISCGAVKNRDEMIRVTKNSVDGRVVFEPNSKIFGRSVYLCYNQNCIDSAFKKNRICKILKTKADIDKSLLNDILSGYSKGTLDGQFKS